MAKKILLRNTGHYAVVDDEDYELINQFSPWYENDSGYAIKKTRVNGKNVTFRMHRIVNNTPSNLVTDHINGNRLDNRRENLRSVGQMINAWNRVENDCHKIYDLPKGVTYDKNRDKYVATKTMRRRFDTLEQAINFTKQSERSIYVR